LSEYHPSLKIDSPSVI